MVRDTYGIVVVDTNTYRADGLEGGEISLSARAQEPDVLVIRIIGRELAGSGLGVVAQAVSIASTPEALRPLGVASREAAHASAVWDRSTTLGTLLLHNHFTGVGSLRHGRCLFDRLEWPRLDSAPPGYPATAAGGWFGLCLRGDPAETTHFTPLPSAALGLQTSKLGF